MNNIRNFSELGIAPPETMAMIGPKIDINKLIGRKIIVHAFSINPSKIKDKENTTCLWMQISLDDGSKRVCFSGSNYLQQMIKQIRPEEFPVRTTIVKKDNDSYQFT